MRLLQNRRQAVGLSTPEGTSCPSRKEGLLMLTYSELFQFCMVIIGICGLFIQVLNSKKK